MEKKSEYQISAYANDGFFEVVITGNAIGSDFEKMMNEVNVILKANNAKKAIFDFCALEGRIEHTEIYRFVRNHHSVIFDIKSAMVDLPENAHYKTALKNACLSLNWFTDIDDARKWFKSEQ